MIVIALVSILLASMFFCGGVASSLAPGARWFVFALAALLLVIATN